MFDVQRSGQVGNVKVNVVKDFPALGRLAGELIAAAVRKKPDLVLGLCTGSTPVPVYKHLVNLFESRRISFSRVKTFNMDEYYPMAPADPKSYRYFMDRNLFNFVDLNPQNVYLPSGLTPDPATFAARYEELILDSGGIDLMLAGLGHNTHIGFNEPPCGPESRTRLITLSQETRNMNARFFSSLEEVPTKSITMGLGTILDSKSLVLGASGLGKAEAVWRALCGPVQEEAPGSFVQRHPHVVAVLDEEAASMLPI
jgi:glucosamine-6-phosphate deaminase